MNLREVIEKTAEQLYNNLPLENLAAAEEMTKYVTRQVIDAIIEDMEEYINTGKDLDTLLISLVQSRYDLKQAREDITSLQP